jgi:argininosuccinate lyase
LAEKGIPFRDAHHISGEIVRYAEEKGVGLDELSAEEMHNFSDLIGDDLPALLTPLAVASAKTSQGGTSPQRVAEQLEKAKKILKQTHK